MVKWSTQRDDRKRVSRQIFAWETGGECLGNSAAGEVAAPDALVSPNIQAHFVRTTGRDADVKPRSLNMTGDSMKIDLETRQQVVDSIHRFYALVDGGRAAITADLFTSDATMTFGPGSPQPGTIEGPAIRASMEARQKLPAFTRHSVSNIALEGEAGGAVAARYLLILFRSDDDSRSSHPAVVADVEESWVAGDGVWKMSKRVVTPTFSRS